MLRDEDKTMLEHQIEACGNQVSLDDLMDLEQREPLRKRIARVLDRCKLRIKLAISCIGKRKSSDIEVKSWDEPL